MSIGTDSRLLPKHECGWQWVDIITVPPSSFITMTVYLAMMETAYRDCKFVANFTPKRARLCKAQMMSFGGFATTDQARLLGDEFAMIPVAEANDFRRQGRTALALARFKGRSSGLPLSI